MADLNSPPPPPVVVGQDVVPVPEQMEEVMMVPPPGQVLNSPPLPPLISLNATVAASYRSSSQVGDIDVDFGQQDCPDEN